MERKNNIISILKTENGKAVLNDIGPEILAELVKRRDQFMEQYNTLSEKKQFQTLTKEEREQLVEYAVLIEAIFSAEYSKQNFDDISRLLKVWVNVSSFAPAGYLMVKAAIKNMWRRIERQNSANLLTRISSVLKMQGDPTISPDDLRAKIRLLRMMMSAVEMICVILTNKNNCVGLDAEESEILAKAESALKVYMGQDMGEYIPGESHELGIEKTPISMMIKEENKLEKKEINKSFGKK